MVIKHKNCGGEVALVRLSTPLFSITELGEVKIAVESPNISRYRCFKCQKDINVNELESV